MGLICIERATGRMREWARHGQPATYDPAVHDLLEQAEPPLEGTRWDGAAWVPDLTRPKSPRELDMEAARAKVDLAVADVAVPKAVRDALAAIKQVLG